MVGSTIFGVIFYKVLSWLNPIPDTWEELVQEDFNKWYDCHTF
jgi:hypothetical protein